MNVLDTWRAWMRAQSLSNRTIAERSACIANLAEHAGRAPLELTADDVIVWLGREGLSVATRATYYGHVSAWSTWLEATGRGSSIVVGVPVPRRRRGTPRPVTSEELRRVLDACNRRRTRAYAMLAAYAGLRVHEVAKLRGEDVRAEADGYVLDVVGKGGQLARIPLAGELAEVVESMPRRGWWFPADTERGHVSGQAVSSAISKAMRRAGVVGTPHALRHWYGSTLLAGGANLRVVQSLMRHESIASTQIYTLVPAAAQRHALVALAA